MAGAVVAGEAGKAALGLLLSDPDVTVPAIKHVLPVALIYDLLLTPVMLWLVTRVARGPEPERAPRPEFSRAQRVASVFRLASAGAAPHLRLAGSGARYQPAVPRRVPKLHLGDGRSSSSSITKAAYSPGTQFPLAGGRTAKLNFAAGRKARAAAFAAPRTHRPGKNWLRAAAASSANAARPAMPRPGRRPGKGWLRGAAPSLVGAAPYHAPRGLSGRPGKRPVFSRTKGFSGSKRRSVSAALSGGSAFSGTSTLSASDVLSARSAPSRLSALSSLSAGGAVRQHRPQAGWLRNSSAHYQRAPRRLAPGRRWLRGARRPGGIPRGNWYTASPSGAWLRRSHNPWRRRRQRLLRLVGVGK
jgi:hypothetical protein